MTCSVVVLADEGSGTAKEGIWTCAYDDTFCFALLASRTSLQNSIPNNV